MSYMALYRKFRPGKFDDVKGQDAIVRTLRNQIKADRVGHAYLFCGTRGTGKTTVAKIFAKAVNCLNPVDGSPCGTCAMCKAIAEGVSLNAIEIDAASNNGVDNIREIREEVSYRPTEGRYKVYIIDEVHMLSAGAFNALLKTLEEPPAYVIFILATTEAHKIPVTILSRCQRYDFKRITIDTIEDRLKELIDIEGWDVEERAIRYIARMADGSMRDALSLLDQCAAFYIGEKLTYDHALEVLGAVDTGVFERLLKALLSYDTAKALAIVEEVVRQGRELGQFVTDFTWYMRNLLLLKSADGMEEVLDVSTENLVRLREVSAMCEMETLMQHIYTFSELGNQLKYATQKRVLFEIAMIKACKPSMASGPEALLERIRALEKQVEEGTFYQGEPVVTERVVYVNAEGEEVKPKEKEEPKLSEALSEDLKEAVSKFRQIAAEAPGLMRTYLKGAKLSAGEGNRLILVFEDEVGAGYFQMEEHKQEMTELIENKIGKKIELDVRGLDRGQRFDDNYVDIERMVHMDITIED